jgi:hypothetical protein
MELIAVLFQKTVEEVSKLSLPQVLPYLATTLAVASSAKVVLSKKQKRKLKWQFFKEGMRKLLHRKKGNGKGAGIFMVLLFLIACAAILWVLWELTGIFGLILGIVGGLGILSLIFKKD